MKERGPAALLSLCSQESSVREIVAMKSLAITSSRNVSSRRLLGEKTNL